MPTINVKILGSVHQISCDQGQEEYLLRLSVSLNTRLAPLAATFPKASDALLLVMNSLLMEDELEEMRNKTSRVGNTGFVNREKEVADLAVIQTLDAIAEYVENVAKKIENGAG